MRITSKGQVTIPIEIRQRLGLLPDCEVEWDVRGDFARLRRAPRSESGRGKRLIEHMRGRATSGLTTDEIMALTRG